MQDRLGQALIVALAFKALVPVGLQLVTTGRPPPGYQVTLTGLPALANQAASVALLGICLVALIGRRRLPLDRPVFIAWTLYALAAALSAFLSGYVPRGTLAITILALLAAGVLQISREAAVRAAVATLAIAVALSLTLALVAPQVAQFAYDPQADWFSRDGRLAGVFEQPNLLALVSAFLLVLLCLGPRPKRRLWTRALMLVAATSLFLTQSYTAWLATAAALGCVQILRARRAHLGPRIASIVGAVVAVILLSSLLASLSESGQLTSVSGRTLVWDFVLTHWADAPLWGHGVGVWTELMQGGALPGWAVHAHNQYLNTLFVGGLVGLSALGWALIATLHTSWRLARLGVDLALGLTALQVVRTYTEAPFELAYGGLNLLLLIVTLFCLNETETYVERPAHHIARPV